MMRQALRDPESFRRLFHTVMQHNKETISLFERIESAIVLMSYDIKVIRHYDEV